MYLDFGSWLHEHTCMNMTRICHCLLYQTRNDIQTFPQDGYNDGIRNNVLHQVKNKDGTNNHTLRPCTLSKLKISLLQRHLQISGCINPYLLNHWTRSCICHFFIFDKQTPRSYILLLNIQSLSCKWSSVLLHRYSMF